MSKIERVINEEVLDKIKEKRQLWKCVQSRRDKMIEHILRHECLLMTKMYGDIEGYIGSGRPKAEYMTQIIKDNMNIGK